MKLRIGETEYDYQLALMKGPLGILYDLKIQGGPGRRAVNQALELFSKGLQAEEGETPEQQQERANEMEEDPRVLLGLAGLIFLTKRYAGESITWEQAREYSWGDFIFVPEEADLAAPPDPQEASGEASQPDAETENVPKSKPRSGSNGTRKTSKRASTSTSSR